jgi:hypothetical protein
MLLGGIRLSRKGAGEALRPHFIWVHEVGSVPSQLPGGSASAGEAMEGGWKAGGREGLHVLQWCYVRRMPGGGIESVILTRFS